MSSKNHRPEPWPARADSLMRKQSLDHADYARAVACVNACAGINPEAVPELLAALRQFMEIESINGGLTGKQTVCGYCGDTKPHERNTRCPYAMGFAALAKAESDE